MKRLFGILMTGIVFTSKETSAVEDFGWLVKDFPTGRNGVADPDLLLSESHREMLVEKIQGSGETILVEGTETPIQVAVAVVGRINLSVYKADTDVEFDEEMAVEAFARSLHDAWGVGYKTPLGGSGVLIFLSIDDRVLYVSRGGALDSVLSDSRIDRIIDGARPKLRQAKYAEGLMGVVEDVFHFVSIGEPTWKERFFELFPLLCVVGLFILTAFLNKRREQREQRDYAQAASHLSELDRAQAEALQGRYQVTSCPICLENFKSSTVGSDDQPIKLLRCGHAFDESCWSEWVNSGQGNVLQCPICRKDVGPQTPVEAEESQVVQTAVEDERNDRDWAVQRFQQERNFRLVRLGSRFPQYITQNQIQRWSSSTHNGSLVRDRTFAQNNPRNSYHRQRAGGGSGTSSVSFGGGGSSGGRGGRF